MDEFYKLCEEHPSVAVAALVGMFLLALLMRRLGTPPVQRPIAQKRKPKTFLDTPLLRLSPYDTLSIRDLLRSVAIFGASGSGKTSGSGYQLAKALVLCLGLKFGGLILASKPDDREFWEKLFAKARRSHDLLVFDEKSPLRFNFLDFIQKSGGDTRDITEAIMVIGEILEQGGKGRDSDKFWRDQNKVMIYDASEIVSLATGKVTAPDLHKFISGAAQSPAALATPEWQAGFHNRCLAAAHANVKTQIQRHDFELAKDYWLKEYPVMADKTRSSILAGVMGILHVFNTGQVRELVSTGTNISPAVMDQGKWVLVDMPISSHGAAGAFVLGGWKYLTQRHILKRKATDHSSPVVIWADEAQKVVNSFDSAFLAECRSHRGCMIYLTQSIHAFYTRMLEGGEHEADSFLTNFYHKIAHALGDDKSAAFFSSLIGKRLVTRFGGSMSPGEHLYDDVFGSPKFSPSFNEQVQNILENREFMQGLRTGGPENGFIVDGIVVRSGEPFSNGEAFLKVAFLQR